MRGQEHRRQETAEKVRDTSPSLRVIRLWVARKKRLRGTMKNDIYSKARERVSATSLEDIYAGALKVAQASKKRRNAREASPERRAYHEAYNKSEQGRAKARIREKRYRDRHPDKVRARIERWESAHPESKKERQKKWRKAHPEQVREHQRKFREKRKNDLVWREKHNAYMREYRKRKKQQKEAALADAR